MATCQSHYNSAAAAMMLFSDGWFIISLHLTLGNLTGGVWRGRSGLVTPFLPLLLLWSLINPLKLKKKASLISTYLTRLQYTLIRCTYVYIIPIPVLPLFPNAITIHTVHTAHRGDWQLGFYLCRSRVGSIWMSGDDCCITALHPAVFILGECCGQNL